MHRERPSRRAVVDDPTAIYRPRWHKGETATHACQWRQGREDTGDAVEEVVGQGGHDCDHQRHEVVIRHATTDDESALEAFDLGDIWSQWLDEVAEIVSGLVAWRDDAEHLPLDRQVVIADDDGEIVAATAHERVVVPVASPSTQAAFDEKFGQRANQPALVNRRPRQARYESNSARRGVLGTQSGGAPRCGERSVMVGHPPVGRRHRRPAGPSRTP